MGEKEKLLSIFEIKGLKPDSYKIVYGIEHCINEILDKTDKPLKKIKINTSIHQQDYDALTIRVIAHI